MVVSGNIYRDNKMATKDQYEFFNQRYVEEAERQRDLLKKSQLYFTTITVLASVLFTNISTLKDFIDKNSQLKITLFILLVDTFLILILLFLSIRVKDYVIPIDNQEYLDNLPTDGNQESDEEFFDNRVADFIAAIDKNQVVNDDKAFFLKISEYGIIGFIFIILIITLQILI